MTDRSREDVQNHYDDMSITEIDKVARRERAKEMRRAAESQYLPAAAALDFFRGRVGGG